VVDVWLQHPRGLGSGLILNQYSEPTATVAVHAFNIPVSEADDGLTYRPDASVRLKAEYFERTDGRGCGSDRGRCCSGFVFSR
jgi:hypothetical protein